MVTFTVFDAPPPDELPNLVVAGHRTQRRRFTAVSLIAEYARIVDIKPGLRTLSHPATARKASAHRGCGCLKMKAVGRDANPVFLLECGGDRHFVKRNHQVSKPPEPSSSHTVIVLCGADQAKISRGGA